MTTEEKTLDILLEAVKLRGQVEGLESKNKYLEDEVNRQHEMIKLLLKNDQNKGDFS